MIVSGTLTSVVTVNTYNVTVTTNAYVTDLEAYLIANLTDVLIGVGLAVDPDTVTLTVDSITSTVDCEGDTTYIAVVVLTVTS